MVRWVGCPFPFVMLWCLRREWSQPELRTHLHGLYGIADGKDGIGKHRARLPDFSANMKGAI